MYLEHFGLEQFPFSTAPDPRFYYPSAKHREALAILLYTIRQHKGFALVSGEVGSGKTMLCRAALQRLGEGIRPAMLVHTLLTPEDLLRAVLAEFGIEKPGESKADLLHALKQFLLRCHAGRETPVLILDEAQDLSVEALEEVRLLGNLETSTEKLLQIILVGQPELRRAIGTDQLRALDQRIAVKFHLGRLADQDVHAYIDHRLGLAGAGDRELFGPEAKQAVCAASEGIPRLVNVICDQALLQAYVQDEPTVSLQTVTATIADIEGYYMDRDAEPSDPEPTAAPQEQEAQPAEPEGAEKTNGTPTFDTAEALADAVGAGRLGPSFSREGPWSSFARYALGDTPVSVTLAQTARRNYAALIVDMSGCGSAWRETVEEAAPQLGYEWVRGRAYIRRGDRNCTLKLRRRSLGLACATGAEGPQVARALRRLHAELWALLRAAGRLDPHLAPPSAAEAPPDAPDEATAAGRDIAALNCPRCGKILTARAEEAGKSGLCPSCGGTVHVPAGAFEEPAEELQPEHRPVAPAAVGTEPAEDAVKQCDSSTS